jgi:hypothetical protein
MKNTYTVRIYAVDFCGFEEDYKVEASCPNEAGELAATKLIEDFVDQMGLVAVGNRGEYIEMDDLEEYEVDPENAETTTISVTVLDDY